MDEITTEKINARYEKLNEETESGGYRLNPDLDFTKALVKGLIVNEARYGYQSCPCRLASGKRENDRDIICPCDYRDPDITDFGACYCGLYVSEKIMRGEKELTSIPERRPPPEKRSTHASNKPAVSISDLPLPVWRCNVCGYLCARTEPPERCPICKVTKDRFERFI